MASRLFSVYGSTGRPVLGNKRYPSGQDIYDDRIQQAVRITNQVVAGNSDYFVEFRDKICIADSCAEANS